MTYVQPVDDDQIPTSNSYVPNVVFVVTQGSPTSNTDGAGKISTPTNVNVKQIGDALLALGQALKAASIPVVLPSDQVVPTLDTNSAAMKSDLDTLSGIVSSNK